MNKKQVNSIIKLLKEKNISFDKGLSDAELVKIKAEFGIDFPSDLKLLLQTALPVSDGFVDWRYGVGHEKAKKEIQNRLNWPKEGMLFDIKNNTFWLDEWGIKPPNFEAQQQIALSEFANYPQLIPICSHRYIPSEPNESGNPVFSVHQMDIIYYGFDLMDYLSNEFKFKLPESFGEITTPKQIFFWSDMVERNG